MKQVVNSIIICVIFAFSAVARNNRIDTVRPDAPELAGWGDYKVGVRTIHLLHKNQVDAARIKAGEALPYYDRPLTLEVWYPADTKMHGGEYKNVLLRDAKTKVSLYGSAVRDAAVLVGDAAHPLVVISHGYPGNRFLMSHFGENLASKGYVVASIDHTDSLYRDAGAFHSTLLNRPLDQKFVLDEMHRMADEEGHFLYRKVDTENAGLMGYSMGGYGAMITAGGGLVERIAEVKEISPNGILKRHVTGSPEIEDLMGSGFKAVIAFAPWGMERGLWDDEALGNVRLPIFFISGSEDKTSGYETGTKLLFEKSKNIDRYLLTFDNANHNAIAPIPAPEEAWETDAYSHYTDMVWDSVRANNIAQHFVTAYFGKMLKKHKKMDAYLSLVPDSNTGEGDTNWKGFKKQSAKGLKLEYLSRE